MFLKVNVNSSIPALQPVLLFVLCSEICLLLVTSFFISTSTGMKSWSSNWNNFEVVNEKNLIL